MASRIIVIGTFAISSDSEREPPSHDFACHAAGPMVLPASREFMNIVGMANVFLVETIRWPPMSAPDFLEQLGYSVRWVVNAEAAIAQVEQDGVRSDGDDIVMPAR